jgi:sulfatase modifying factor 1
MTRTAQFVRVAAFVSLCLPWVSADDVLVQSFDSGGTLTFNVVTNATAYRIEWSPAGVGSWTNFAAAAALFDTIPATGGGVVTARVPVFYRVVASVTNPPAVLPGMAFIAGGGFVMGEPTNVFTEGYANEEPPHTVSVGAYYIDTCEVSKALWDEVRIWAATNGYAFENTGGGKATNHPVQMVNWYDAVKWCNARSERAGLVPCYTTNGLTYKTGNNSNVVCSWSASGYRLPTDAEWEKAARGGVANTRFPWSDFTNKISHTNANYYGNKAQYPYDLSTGNNSAYATGGLPYTSPVGSFAPNGFGLYDMAGNVCEWVWDWYDGNYYGVSPSTDPTGPTSGAERVLRGSAWDGDAFFARCSARNYADPTLESNDFGFRCVRRP